MIYNLASLKWDFDSCVHVYNTQVFAIRIPLPNVAPFARVFLEECWGILKRGYIFDNERSGPVSIGRRRRVSNFRPCNGGHPRAFVSDGWWYCVSRSLWRWNGWISQHRVDFCHSLCIRCRRSCCGHARCPFTSAAPGDYIWPLAQFSFADSFKTNDSHEPSYATSDMTALGLCVG